MTLLEVARALVMCTDYALHSFRRRTYAITISPRPLISPPTPCSRDGQVLSFLPQPPSFTPQLGARLSPNNSPSALFPTRWLPRRRRNRRCTTRTWST
jgi:hypothetical protein